MPIRNIWSLEPAECIVAEELTNRLRGCQVFFPLHDVGVDLLVVKGEKHLSLQVKESRYYSRRGRRIQEHSWHQVHRRKFVRDRDIVDFYIFVTYLPKYGEHRFSSFEKKFLIVPTSEIARRIEVKNMGKKGVYSFYFHFDSDEVVDQRETVEEIELMEYSRFLDAWHLIEHTL